MEPGTEGRTVRASAEGTDVLGRWIRHGGAVREVARGSGLVRLELLTCDGHEPMELLVLDAQVWDDWQTSQA